MKTLQHVKAYLYLPVQIAVGLVLGGVASHLLHYPAHWLNIGH